MRTLRGLRTVWGVLYALALMTLPVYYGACATVQAGWVSDPIPAMTASVMSAKPCSPPAFRDPSPNVNRQNGWTSLDPAGGSMPSCRARAIIAQIFSPAQTQATYGKQADNLVKVPVSPFAGEDLVTDDDCTKIFVPIHRSLTIKARPTIRQKW